MPTISVRLDKDALKEIEFLKKEYKTDKSEIIRRLLDKGVKQAKLEKILEMLRKHKISIEKAAELANLTIYEIIELCKENEIHIGYAKEDLKRDLQKFKL